MPGGFSCSSWLPAALPPAQGTQAEARSQQPSHPVAPAARLCREGVEGTVPVTGGSLTPAAALRGPGSSHRGGRRFDVQLREAGPWRLWPHGNLASFLLGKNDFPTHYQMFCHRAPSTGAGLQCKPSLHGPGSSSQFCPAPAEAHSPRCCQQALCFPLHCVHSMLHTQMLSPAAPQLLLWPLQLLLGEESLCPAFYVHYSVLRRLDGTQQAAISHRCRAPCKQGLTCWGVCRLPSTAAVAQHLWSRYSALVQSLLSPNLAVPFPRCFPPQ